MTEEKLYTDEMMMKFGKAVSMEMAERMVGELVCLTKRIYAITDDLDEWMTEKLAIAKACGCHAGHAKYGEEET